MAFVEFDSWWSRCFLKIWVNFSVKPKTFRGDFSRSHLTFYQSWWHVFKKLRYRLNFFDHDPVHFSETDDLFQDYAFYLFSNPPSKSKSRPRSSPHFLCSRSLFIYIGLHFNLLDQPFTLTKRSRRQHFYSIKIKYTTHPLLKYSLTPL